MKRIFTNRNFLKGSWEVVEIDDVGRYVWRGEDKEDENLQVSFYLFPDEEDVKNIFKNVGRVFVKQ